MTGEPPRPDQSPAPLPDRGSDLYLPPPFGRAASAGRVVVLFVFMWVGMVLVGGVAQLWLGFAANAVLTECLVILAPVYLLVRKLGLRKALGLQRPPDSGTLLWALLGVLALAVLIAEFTHWSDRVFPMPESIKAAYLEAVTAESLPELLLLLIAAGCVPGFCEEAAFRGFFQQVGVARLGRHGGIALAASLFAVMHLDPWHLVALFFIGLYLGYLFAWTANLWIPAAAHAANNAVSVLLLYVDPQTGLSQMSEPPPRWLLPLAVAALVIALVRIRRSDSGPNRVALARQSGVESQDSVCG